MGNRLIYLVPVVAVGLMLAISLIVVGLRYDGATVGAEPVNRQSVRFGAGSCCGGSGQGSLQAAEAEALRQYKAEYGDASVTARAIDYGCHVEVAILKDGAAVKRYSYLGGNRLFEID